MCKSTINPDLPHFSHWSTLDDADHSVPWDHTEDWLELLQAGAQPSSCSRPTCFTEGQTHTVVYAVLQLLYYSIMYTLMHPTNFCIYSYRAV